MRILHLTPTLDPHAGGLAEGVRQSALALAALGHRVEAASLDAPGAPFLEPLLAECSLPLAALGPGYGKYGRTPNLVPWLREHGPRFDAVIVNGLWQYHSFAAWLALRSVGVRYYVFPHGMLDPWFKHTYPFKHLKKWLYWPWAEYRLLRDAQAVLFTTEEERLLARQSFWLYRAREQVVSYGTGKPPADSERHLEAFHAAYPALRGRRIVLFLGRLHPKKGCDLLIHAFARLASEVPDAHLVLAGPGNNDAIAALRSIAAQAGIAERITWTGMLQGDLKWGAFRASDAFALPSHQENFGIAVVEALACGLPVLISDKVNIWREVASDGAGFVAGDTLEGTVQNLRRWFMLDEVDRERMRMQAAATFRERFTVDAHTQRLLNVLEADAAHDTYPVGRPSVV
ncbi:MAG TPA: glycosyltransferase [Trinickia sp.]|jgi:glycosyltransferase involved in cell wall biosynthesis|uniref:glycosyltransferase n=1 Tax=Trinickia sp. TaxID=2571163 RepID=UPI002C726167|nr:glycosyltransferase [Trinickia sp.]HTI19149.1 glycosyltransferase [Trinickia sp.]